MSTTAIKERPILFTPAMAQAVHEGRKTQTRRIIKPQPPHGVQLCMIANRRDLDGVAYKNHAMTEGLGCDTVFYPCPYGIEGDRLYCKENYRFGIEWDDTSPRDVPPQAWDDKGNMHGVVWYDGAGDCGGEEMGWGRLRPSIYMPRWACRTALEITDVRVQRVQDISEDDARAEGVADRAAFLNLFYDINKRSARDQNPFVWCITFRKID